MCHNVSAQCNEMFLLTLLKNWAIVPGSTFSLCVNTIFAGLINKLFAGLLLRKKAPIKGDWSFLSY